MSEIKTSETYREKAKVSADKRATLGEDIDLSNYVASADEQPYQDDPSQIPVSTKEQMMEAGVLLDDVSQRAGTRK